MSDASDALKKSAATIRKAASEAAAELGDSAVAVAEKAGDAAAKAGDAAAPTLADASQRLTEAVKDPQSREELFDLLEGAAREIRDAAAVYARREPIKSVLWAAALGAMAMALIRSATAPHGTRARNA